MTDQTFRKIFVSLSALGIIVFLVLIVSLLTNIELNSLELWIGITIIYSTIVCFYTFPLYGKIITLFLSTFAFSAFLFLAFSWPISFSIIFSFIPIVIVFGLFALL